MSGQEGLTVIPSCLASSKGCAPAAERVVGQAFQPDVSVGCAPAAERIDWEGFFLVHDPMIRHVVAHYAARRADVDDLHQEVRKKLARKLPGFQLDPARGTLSGWVSTVAHRVATEKARRMSRHPTEELTPELADALLDPGPSPATLTERRLDKAELQASLVELRSMTCELNHRIVVLRLIEERSVPQIAIDMGLSEHCVKMRLGRAVKKLQALLRERGFGPP